MLTSLIVRERDVSAPRLAAHVPRCMDCGDPLLADSKPYDLTINGVRQGTCCSWGCLTSALDAFRGGRN